MVLRFMLFLVHSGSFDTCFAPFAKNMNKSDQLNV